MCGNGLRCMALYLHRRTHQKTHHFEIMTLAGTMKATILADGVRCEIGAATLKGKLTIHCDGHQFDGYQLSTGNPHFVIFDPVHDNLRKKCAEITCSSPIVNLLASTFAASTPRPPSNNLGFLWMSNHHIEPSSKQPAHGLQCNRAPAPSLRADALVLYEAQDSAEAL